MRDDPTHSKHRIQWGIVGGSAYRRDVTDNRDDCDDEPSGSPGDESPPNPGEPVGQLTFTVNPKAWQRFKYHSLRTRVQRELEETQKIWPSGGSPLDADNRYLIGFGASFQELIINRLFSTFDHLQLAVWTLESMEGPQIFPQYSLLRSALAGAATTHWLVSGDETTRRMCALRLAFYDLNQEATFGKLHAANPATHEPELAESLRKTEQLIASAPGRLDKIHQEYCRLLATTSKRKPPKFDGFGNINETEIISAASRMMHERGLCSHPTEIELQYRLMSGFVHNCTWATRAGAKTKTKVGEDRAERQLAGNADNIYNGAMTAFNIGKLAKARVLELARIE